MRRSGFYLLVMFLLSILYVPSVSLAKVETITHTVKQPFGGSQSPDDARVAAMAKAKREALERAGTYIESLTVVKDHVVEKDEILALAAGVLKAEIVSQKNYATEDAFGVVVVARVDVDTSVLEERVKKLLQDRTLLEKHRESRRREKELLAKVERLEAENRRLQALSVKGQEQKKTELKEQFHNTAQALTAIEWFQKALALWRDGKHTDPKKALEYLDQAIRLDPKNAPTHNNRGNAYVDLGQYKRAIEDYDQAIRLDPKYVNAYNNRGVAYEDLGQYKRAIEDYDQAIRLDSKYAPAYVNRGVSYCLLGQYKRAIDDYDQAIRLDSKNAPAYNNRANAYKDLGQYKRAIEDYDQAIRLDPRFGRAYVNRGFAYFGLENVAGACRDLHKACALGSCDGLSLAETKGLCQ